MALPVLGMASGGLAAFQMYSSFLQAEHTERVGELNQEIAQFNADFAELEAHDAEKDGMTRSARYQSVIDEVTSQQTAEYAAADVDINFGSVGEFREEASFVGQLNQMEIQREARLKSMGLKSQARGFSLQGVLDRGKSDALASSQRLQGITSAAKTSMTGYSYYT